MERYFIGFFCHIDTDKINDILRQYPKFRDKFFLKKEKEENSTIDELYIEFIPKHAVYLYDLGTILPKLIKDHKAG